MWGWVSGQEQETQAGFKRVGTLVEPNLTPSHVFRIELDTINHGSVYSGAKVAGEARAKFA